MQEPENSSLPAMTPATPPPDDLPSAAGATTTHSLAGALSMLARWLREGAHTVLLHRSYPSAPHRAAASLSAIHIHGAVQTGYSPADVVCVSATIPIAALTVPHMTATIPRIRRILTY